MLILRRMIILFYEYSDFRFDIPNLTGFSLNISSNFIENLFYLLTDLQYFQPSAIIFSNFIIGFLYAILQF